MRFELPSLRKSPTDALRVDGRGQMFFAGSVVTLPSSPLPPSRVSELLAAIPMVKVDEAAINTAVQGQLSVNVKRATGLSAPTTYTNTTVIQTIPFLPGSESQVNLARIGMRFQAMLIDDKATPDITAHREAYWKALTAAYSVLKQLDTQLAIGDATLNPAQLKGLKTLTPGARSVATTGDIAKDARLALSAVGPNGNGPGQGPSCLIGNANILRKLMAVTSGQTGGSMWMHDKVSGTFCYHYMGVPFYRTDLDVEAGTTGVLYAANLGPTGLNLLYAHGSQASFGLAIDETTPATGVGVKDLVVHGAWGLALWEDEAIYRITGIDISTATGGL